MVPLPTTANDNKVVLSYWSRAKHIEHYESVDCSLDYFDSDSESEVDENTAKTSLSHAMNENLQNEVHNNVNWHEFLLIVGKHGTRKLYTLTKAIEMCLSTNHKVLVGTSTGCLYTI